MAEQENISNGVPGSTTSLAWTTSTTILIKNEETKVPTNNIKINGHEIYNPYQHRVVTHPNGFTGAFLHIVKTSLGTGILAIPRAFKNAGLLVGFIGTIIVGIICTHAIHLLVKASHKVCIRTKNPSFGYADSAKQIFKTGPPFLRKYSNVAKYFVEGGLFSIHFLSDAVYIVFISVSLTKLFSAYYPETESWDRYIFQLILLVPLLICGQVRELKHLVPFSFIANVMLLVSFGIVGYYIFSGIGDVDTKDRNLANGITGLPSYFSTVLFSMEGIGTVMPVENSMITENFIDGCPNVVNSGMLVIISLYTAIGFLGYYRFGEATEATITKNLPSDEIPAQICQATIAVAVFFSFMLVFYVPSDIAWSNLKHRIPASRHNISQIALRTTLIILATGIAIAGGENLGTLIDLIGAIFLSTLGLFVPALLDIIVDWEEGWGKFHWRLVKNLLIMSLAFFGMVSGSYYALYEI